MKLKQYLDMHHIEYKGACQELGISYSSFFTICNEKYDPRKSFIEKVKKYTGGAVKYKDWDISYLEKDEKIDSEK